MRTSRYLIATTKETPSDAAVISHQLMLKAGFIRKLAAGLYTWLPLGLRVQRKVSDIIRQEMDAAGGIEVSMPVVQPAELWLESGRWDQMGSELQRFQDRHGRDFCLGPTHEEVITDLVRNEISSYKQLPLNLYQIQTKFRDERRPRFGVMRSREFIMKDAYSFHIDQESLQATYDLMFETYSKIFTRLGFKFRPVQADSGNIGGSSSHEFHVLADSGEDEIVFSDNGTYAANIEMASALAPTTNAAVPTQDLELVATPDIGSIEEVGNFLKVEKSQLIKTLIFLGAEENSLVALVLRGDHQLNEVKASKINAILAPLTFATDAQVQDHLNCQPGSIGPIAIPDKANISIVVDRDAAILSDFICGANQTDYHYRGANWERDCGDFDVADIRNVVAGDLSPDGQGTLSIARGIEVGHIFQLGNKYSQSMKATVLNNGGKSTVLEMGCYGIGVTRIVAAAIEQNHDENGIIWPDQIAPFHLALIPLNAHKSEKVIEVCNSLYEELNAIGIEVLMDDRDKKTSPGVKFADMELIGIPHRLVISDRGLNNNMVEYKKRAGNANNETQDIPLEDIVEFLKEVITF